MIVTGKPVDVCRVRGTQVIVDHEEEWYCLMRETDHQPVTVDCPCPWLPACDPHSHHRLRRDEPWRCFLHEHEENHRGEEQAPDQGS